MSMLNGRSYLLLVLVVVFAPLVGCVPSIVGAGDPDAQSGQPEPSDQALPDFSVVDVNPDSTRNQEAVSPRDYLGQISAWYFGHST